MKLEQKLYNKVVSEIETTIFDLEEKKKNLNLSPANKQALEDQLNFLNEILDLLFIQHDQLNDRNVQLKSLYKMLFEEGIE